MPGGRESPAGSRYCGECGKPTEGEAGKATARRPRASTSKTASRPRTAPKAA